MKADSKRLVVWATVEYLFTNYFKQAKHASDDI